MTTPFRSLRSQATLVQLARRFQRLLRAHRSAENRDESLLPTHVCRATRDILRADGVSLSFSDGDDRVPIGACSLRAMRAEQLQFTVGTGPCLEAIASGMPVIASAPRLRTRWPLLADAWAEQTGFVSAVSTPLLDPGRTPWGAMNVFFEAPDGPRHVLPLHLTVLGQLVSDRLLTPSGNLAEGLERTEEAVARRQVWLAVGALSARAHVDPSDALARLRAHAYHRDRTLDEIAATVIADPRAVNDLT